jgi:hypothetical protein
MLFLGQPELIPLLHTSCVVGVTGVHHHAQLFISQDGVSLTFCPAWSQTFYSLAGNRAHIWVQWDTHCSCHLFTEKALSFGSSISWIEASWLILWKDYKIKLCGYRCIFFKYSKIWLKKVEIFLITFQVVGIIGMSHHTQTTIQDSILSFCQSTDAVSPFSFYVYT